jgi:hypothetical protein
MFYFDVNLILEKLQHYFRKFSKIKSFSEKQSKGWLLAIIKNIFAVHNKQIMRPKVKKILNKIISASSVR